LIAELFAQTDSLRNDRTFPAANFQFVAVEVFEEKCVIARTVAFANLRPFQILPTGCAHEFRDPIHFLPCVGPECDARAVWLMIFVFGKPKKFRGLVASGGIKGMEIVAWTFVNKSEVGQEFPVNFLATSMSLTRKSM